MSLPRVQFIHGLESSPQGTKARLFAQHFDALTASMNTDDFPACVELQSEALTAFHPDLLIGSSFGGAVAVALLHRAVWKGPTLLLAQAAFHYDVPRFLPTGLRVWLVHGRQDDVVDIADSCALSRTGSADLVRLIEVDDDHALSATVASGRLVEWVREMVAGDRPSGA